MGLIFNQEGTKIIIPRRVSLTFVRQHPELVFVYSNDFLQRGCEGMVWHFKGEPNAFMVPTMYKYCANAKYFQDVNFDHWSKVILGSILAIPRDRPIIPMERMGLGCSRMKEFAPKLYAFMRSELDKIKAPNLTIDYNDTQRKS